MRNFGSPLTEKKEREKECKKGNKEKKKEKITHCKSPGDFFVSISFSLKKKKKKK